VAIADNAEQPIRIGKYLTARVLFVCLHNTGRSQMSHALSIATPLAATQPTAPARPRAHTCILSTSRIMSTTTNDIEQHVRTLLKELDAASSGSSKDPAVLPFRPTL
jgi:hypothetical protein